LCCLDSGDSRRHGNEYSGGLQSQTRVWDVAEDRESLVLEQKAEFIPGVDWSPDGKRLAVAKGREVGLWDAESGEKGLTLQVRDGVTSPLWSPDGHWFAVAGLIRNKAKTFGRFGRGFQRCRRVDTRRPGRRATIGLCRRSVRRGNGTVDTRRIPSPCRERRYETAGMMTVTAESHLPDESADTKPFGGQFGRSNLLHG